MPKKGIDFIVINTYYPTHWKEAKIIAFPKINKNGADVKNYRPISLLPFLSKITEKIVQRGLIDHIEIHDVLIPKQFGIGHFGIIVQLIKLLKL